MKFSSAGLRIWCISQVEEPVLVDSDSHVGGAIAEFGVATAVDVY